MATILVTGYGGFLGSAVVKQLLAGGHSVRGIARGTYPELESLGVHAIRGDVSDSTAVGNALEGCDAVIHTAAKAGVWGSWESYHQINTQAAVDLFGAAESLGIKAFVQTSSPSVTFDGEHQSGVDESVPYPTNWLCHYPHTKALAEKAILQASGRNGTLSCALRPHLIWGEGDPHLFPRVIERTLQRRLRRVGNGKNLIDVVHVDNAARAHVLAVERLLDGDQALSGEAMFITDGDPVECWHWISKILELADVAVPNRSISFSAAYRVGAVLEVAYRLLRRQSEPPMTRFVAAQLALDHYFDISRARELLGYEPNVDTAEKLEACRPWLQHIARAN
ncbi:MAG: NAD-dependent epimerase/dehydratase family protein [Planctomycetota bacterium]